MRRRATAVAGGHQNKKLPKPRSLRVTPRYFSATAGGSTTTRPEVDEGHFWFTNLNLTGAYTNNWWKFVAAAEDQARRRAVARAHARAPSPLRPAPTRPLKRAARRVRSHLNDSRRVRRASSGTCSSCATTSVSTSTPTRGRPLARSCTPSITTLAGACRCACATPHRSRLPIDRLLRFLKARPS